MDNNEYRGLSLELRDVGVQCGGNVVLMDISMAVRSGEFIGVLGPSGSGKSTLIEILSLTGRMGEGNVYFDGNKNIRDDIDEYAARLGYVSQDDVLYPRLTVRENLHYAARLRLPDADPETIEDAINRQIERFELTEQRDRKVEFLSGGQRKRVNIAMELLRKPRLLILDEPTSGLDPAMEKAVMQDLRKIADNGTTVICSTHVMDSLELFDRVAVIGKKKTTGQSESLGGLEFYETPALLKDYYHVDTYAELYRHLKEDPGFLYLRAAPTRNESGGLKSKSLKRKITRQQILDVFRKSLTLFVRDPSLCVLTALLPLVLGYLVVLSQLSESNIRPMLFFSIVIALWFGMNNSVRSIVSERKHFVRDHLAGLAVGSFLAGKSLFYLFVGLIQLLCFWLILFTGTDNGDFSKILLLFPCVLLGSYVCGLGMGLLVSTLSSTENTAISWVPLLIMPQLLLSCVAAGNSADDLHDPTRLRPVCYEFWDQDEESDTTLMLHQFKALSLLCYSRPASSVLEFPIRNIKDNPAMLMESLYFFVQGFVTWTTLLIVFYWRQRRWRESRWMHS